MTASAATRNAFQPTWLEPSRLPVRHILPARERRWARSLRWLADRRHLLEMDARLLEDVGLTREDVWRGVPVQGAPHGPESQACNSALIRLGTLEAQGWRLKLYAPTAEAAGLRPEDLAAARRCFRAIAIPCGQSVAGFAMLAGGRDVHLPTGSLALTTWSWTGMVLHRVTVLVSTAGEAVRRVPDHGLGLAELLLAAREGQAWQRHARRLSPSSLAAYVAENCA